MEQGLGVRVPEAHNATGDAACGEDTVEGLRDLLQDVLGQLAQSRRRRDPVVALKIACKEACHWFAKEKGRGRRGGARGPVR
jgi:hypothetical protein